MNSDENRPIESICSNSEANESVSELNLASQTAAGHLMTWASAPQIEQLSARISKLDSTDYSEAITQEVWDAIEKSPTVSHDFESSRAQQNSSFGANHINIYGHQNEGIIASNNDGVELSGVSGGYNYGGSLFEIMERIWLFNDQRASVFLQERMRLGIPEECKLISMLIMQSLEILMVHRFGNFLVQCMLEVALPSEVEHIANQLGGRIAQLAKNQFCCHVIQKLVDVSPLVIQARLTAEMLDDVVDTMVSPFGTHVWQKLLHLKWPLNLPAVSKLASNAVHLVNPSDGWMAITVTEAGCATVKSYIGVAQANGENMECIDELLSNVAQLMVEPAGSRLIPRLLVIHTSRSRTMALLFSRAYEYCKHPVASASLINVLKMKIPSFPSRLGAAVAPYYNDLLQDRYGREVILALEQGPIFANSSEDLHA